MARKHVFVEVRREGKPTETIERPLHNGDVCLGGKWLKVETDAESGKKFVEAGPVPPITRSYSRGSMARFDPTMMMLMTLPMMFGMRSRR